MPHPAIIADPAAYPRRRATDLPVLYLRVSDELYAAVQQQATAAGKTVNGWCTDALWDAVFVADDKEQTAGSASNS